MTATAYASAHPDVLAAWAEIQAQDDVWTDVVKAVEVETGRKIYTTTGWGDSRVAGLSNEEPLPEGWRKAPRTYYIVPRAKGPGSKEAQTILDRLRAAFPQARQMLHDMFGVPPVQFSGLHALTCGVALWDGTLWVFYGDHDIDKPWDGGDYFETRPMSAYYAAKEAHDD